ncbi:sigma-54 interaction domain protein [delta proteobacterium NaphS2]|nr:sigma-54 interaction domain protein [delta proteobacterium NaphS2]
MKTKILFVDDEPEFLHVLKSYFSIEPYEIQTAGSAQKALRVMAKIPFDVVVTDMSMDPGMSGLDLLQEIRRTDALLPVIIMTGVGTIETAVEAIQSGAFHYITKPFNPQDLEILVRRAVENARLHRRLVETENRMEGRNGYVIGHNRRIRDILSTIDKVAESEAPILLTGETGTGKSLFARRVHKKSRRRNKPFITIDCAALTETLLESELFGHVKGAFTGAISAKRGLLEEAQSGTVFLDEIGELTPSTQVKLLRAVQEREIKPVGGNRPIHIDVRFVSATSRDLNSEIEQNRFREDLYFRLAVIPLCLPPLRERGDDLPEFVAHFVGIFNQRYKKCVTNISPTVMQMLARSPWKGNIRELENTIERAVLLSEGDTITRSLLLFPDSNSARDTDQEHEQGPVSLKQAVMDAEKNAIVQVLSESGNNRTEAARRLGIGRRTLYDKMTAYGLD